MQSSSLSLSVASHNEIFNNSGSNEIDLLLSSLAISGGSGVCGLRGLGALRDVRGLRGLGEGSRGSAG